MERLARRQALKRAGFGALGAGALAALGTVPVSADGGTDLIVGTWDVTFRQTHPKPDHLESLLAFAPGGAVVEADASGPSPSLGTWRRSEDGVVFSIKSWIFNPDGSLFGKARVNCKASVDAGSVEGAFHITVYDTNGAIIFSGTGTLSGTPVEARYP
jgi:hypothetical protein